MNDSYVPSPDKSIPEEDNIESADEAPDFWEVAKAKVEVPERFLDLFEKPESWTRQSFDANSKFLYEHRDVFELRSIPPTAESNFDPEEGEYKQILQLAVDAAIIGINIDNLPSDNRTAHDAQDRIEKFFKQCDKAGIATDVAETFVIIREPDTLEKPRDASGESAVPVDTNLKLPEEAPEPAEQTLEAKEDLAGFTQQIIDVLKDVEVTPEIETELLSVVDQILKDPNSRDNDALKQKVSEMFGSEIELSEVIDDPEFFGLNKGHIIASNIVLELWKRKFGKGVAQFEQTNNSQVINFEALSKLAEKIFNSSIFNSVSSPFKLESSIYNSRTDKMEVNKNSIGNFIFNTDWQSLVKDGRLAMKSMFSGLSNTLLNPDLRDKIAQSLARNNVPLTGKTETFDSQTWRTNIQKFLDTYRQAFVQEIQS